MADLDYVVPTGDYIEEWLEDSGMSQADLARSLDCSRKHVSKLIHGAPLTHDLALRLARVTGVPAERWMQIESFYRDEQARLELEHEPAAVKDLLRKLPLKFLRDQGYVRSTLRDPGRCAFEVMAFYRVGTLGALRKQLTQPVHAVAFRQSQQLDWAARLTWLRMVEMEAAEATEELSASFNPAELNTVLPELRSLTRQSASVYGVAMRELLADVGVRLVFAQSVPKAGTYGIARWYRGAPLVALSLHRKSEDQLWFTLFHELFHVANHELSPEGYVSGVWEDGRLEDEANRFAGEFLIPKKHESALASLKSDDDVIEFAEEIGISPGIVVGRLHRDQLWNYTKGNNLILKLRFVESD